MSVGSQRDKLERVIIQRDTATLPQATQSALFTVSGRVIIEYLIGEVTTAIQNQETVIKLIANPTVGADVDLCTAVDIDNDAVGTMYMVTGDFSDALTVNTSGAIEGDGVSNFIVADGTIDLDSDDDSSTGSIKWTIHYRALDAGSTIEVA